MPKITDPKIDEGEDELGRYRAELLSDAGDLTQFGAFTETLWPGAKASQTHWHANEDEMIHVLSGTVTLIEGDTETDLIQGDTATFKAGVPTGHHLENRTQAPCRYLVIGTRSHDDTVTYSKTGETVTIIADEKVYRDAEGNITKVEPYHGA